MAFAGLGYLLGGALGHDGAEGYKKESGHPVKDVRSFLSSDFKDLPSQAVQLSDRILQGKVTKQNPMLFQKAQKFLSVARLAPYLQATLGDEQEALQLYLNNLKVAQSFHTPLSILEVSLRNAVHDVLERYFSSPNWLLEQQTGFMNDSRLTSVDYRSGKEVTNNKILKMVQAASAEFEQHWRYRPTTGNALIAELHFGFWTTLFSPTYYGILQKSPLRAFANRPRGRTDELPRGIDREIIYNKLRDIRLFRNRVYHYEPLCFQKQSSNILCFSHLFGIHSSIIELLSWLDLSLPEWLKEADRVPETLRKLQKKYPEAS